MSNTSPILDIEQNWELLVASESEDKTHLKFRRPFETTDSNDINITVIFHELHTYVLMHPCELYSMFVG